MYKRVIYALFICLIAKHVKAQDIVPINGDIKQIIFAEHQIQCLEDPQNKLTFDDVHNGAYKNAFQTNKVFYPINDNRKSTYWYRIRLNFTENIVGSPSIFEFFDQTTDNIVAYMPDAKGN